MRKLLLPVCSENCVVNNLLLLGEFAYGKIVFQNVGIYQVQSREYAKHVRHKKYVRCWEK